ncbi:helix-turn-helix domain-containing protein [Novosphingobium sp. ZW T3_23]|uniref:helix-turn-helix domain-containing protein n=1 Tax=Novosphingobium sp. ZW T3_23 TaxID=3378084 RepID=UPI0038549B5B
MQSEDQRKSLGAFVRARRESMTPEGHDRRRRTPGLRREELAARAAIGTTWIAWIEQGRDVRPSAETLARLAGGLSLSAAERDYLFSLAGRHDPIDLSARAGASAPSAIAALVGQMDWPCYALDPAWSICAANGAARRLFIGLFEYSEAPNLLRYVFAHPAARQLLPDWSGRAARLLAEFRRDYGHGMADPRVTNLVLGLQDESPEFRAAWNAQTVLAREGGERVFQHPDDGRLHFTQHTLSDVERGDFRVVFLEPG